MKNRQDASPRRKARPGSARHGELRRRTRPNDEPVFVDVSQVEGAFRRLRPELVRALIGEGYKTPTPVQEESIPELLAGKDLLGTAQTGTGKTAAFALPLLERLSKSRQRPEPNTPKALILAPTRELAAQIGDSLTKYGRFLRVSHTVIFGGVPQFHQVKALKRGVDVLVATPGRLLDLCEQGHIFLGNAEVLVLDEVDRMLDMGFMPDIQRVLEQVPDERQTLFFSATMPPKMAKLAETIVRDPVRVSIEPEQLTVDRITQRVLFVGKQNKDALLISLLRDTKVSKAIVFTQMKHVANKVTERLGKVGVSGVAIHGNKSQSVRLKALKGFKEGRYRVLVATDVAARGLDVDDVTHVINYDLPVEAETYVHRIGRTARAGAGGDAISFCSAEERAYLRDIERMLGERVPPKLDHDWHDEDSMNSLLPAPENFGRGASRIQKRGRSGNVSHASGQRDTSDRRPSRNGREPVRDVSRPRRRSGPGKGNFDVFIQQNAALDSAEERRERQGKAKRPARPSRARRGASSFVEGNGSTRSGKPHGGAPRNSR